MNLTPHPCVTGLLRVRRLLLPALAGGDQRPVRGLDQRAGRGDRKLGCVLVTILHDSLLQFMFAATAAADGGVGPL